ncbi:hypothetical protein ABPG77_003818 [Micractinium sp. CCAP 211/92]
MDAAGLVEACRLGDRASCDALEFEGIAAAPSRRGTGSWLGSRFVPSGGSAAAAYWHPTTAELAFAERRGSRHRRAAHAADRGHQPGQPEGGEVESEEEEWGGEESELTQACVRRLQQSAEFKAYLRARGLTTADVGTATRRLRLYRRLRRLDPAAFWQLLRPGSRTVLQSRAPSRLLLAADYILSCAANLAAAAAAYCLWWGSSATLAPPAVAAAGAAALLWAVVAQWLRARPTAGMLFGLWYEEERWGHAAPAWRCVAASLLETAYVGLSAGLGLGISLYLRCLSARRQGVGEMLLAIHPVQEVAAAAPGEDSE